MHIAIASLLVALIVCLLLLVAFWVFTTTPLARRIAEKERRQLPRDLRRTT